MHLQQTKRDSIKSGGPQYYFHNLSEAVKIYLRKKGAVKVALVTPYGATKTNFFAVGKEHKIDSKGKIVSGNVGHDRIQQGKAEASIGESIRKWYNLKDGDFERIDVDIQTFDDCFYLTPVKIKYASKGREQSITRVERPLTFSHTYVSPFWKAQLEFLKKKQQQEIEWALKEICRVVSSTKERIPHLQEPDLLRASGSLKLLGVALGPYVGKGYDCFSNFEFQNYPPYSVPVEIKKFSNGFSYQQKKYGKDELSRAVILCAVDDIKYVQPNIDIIELDEMCGYIGNL
ncbi:MAG TPA: hypothetical protein VI757_10590 [Bacteroidia bacterium]|nr:hypothetical protein [Bacteroidia bacterium]